jgi:hypothetical protein
MCMAVCVGSFVGEMGIGLAGYDDESRAGGVCAEVLCNTFSSPSYKHS